jgi:hypothetical protein
MKIMKKSIIMISSALLLFASCGQQHKAESTVEDMLEDNLTNASQMKVIMHEQLDSTRLLTNSNVLLIRKSMADIPYYKKGIKYAPMPKDNMLMISCVVYQLGNKKYRDTYYLDRSLENVIAIKSKAWWY